MAEEGIDIGIGDYDATVPPALKAVYDLVVSKHKYDVDMITYLANLIGYQYGIESVQMFVQHWSSPRVLIEELQEFQCFHEDNRTLRTSSKGRMYYAAITTIHKSMTKRSEHEDVQFSTHSTPSAHSTPSTPSKHWTPRSQRRSRPRGLPGPHSHLP